MIKSNNKPYKESVLSLKAFSNNVSYDVFVNERSVFYRSKFFMIFLHKQEVI